MKKIFTVIIFLFVAVQFSFPQWSTDPQINTPICLAPNGQGESKIISDGQGGSIITWRDDRGSSEALYAQRLNSNGVSIWNNDGILVNTVPNARYDEFQLISDGSGGCIIVWEEDGSGPDRVFAQRLNSNGNIQWTVNGVPICTSMSVSPELIEDGFGGAIITWEDWRINGDQNIYAQRINSSGTELWTINGIAVCTAIYNQKRPKIISDGSNGSIIVWRDYRNNTNYDIYAQKISSSGNFEWIVDGIPVSISSFDKTNLSIISDDNNGAIISWSAYIPSNNNYDIYTQRINSIGALQWQTTGIPIDTTQSRTYHKEIVRDGNNGAIFTWIREDENNYKVCAQRINPTGDLLWGIDGIQVCVEDGRHYSSQIVSDNSGGAIVTWADYRNGEFNADIYAQRINNNGQVNWILNGIGVSIADSNQSDPNIMSNGYGGAVIVWTDGRNFDSDIYAQKINSDGSLGGTTGVEGYESFPNHFSLFQNYPNPFNPITKIKFSIPKSEIVQLKVYDVLGNEIKTLLNDFKTTGTYEIEFDASNLPSGVYFYRMISGNYSETKKMLLLR